MARRKKGRDISGWLIVDKPAGLTSTTVVNKVRWALDAKKAGHAGTLDPAATGVLAIALGEATKTVPWLTEALKCYRFTINFGQATNTDDAEGEVIAQSDQRPSDNDIREALGAFEGDIMQVPPKFSAVKVEGQRAYAMAREGADIELAARTLYVDKIQLVERPDADQAVIEMVCGKGGYVRSVARDLGAALGCYGHVETLRRIWSGPFEVEDGLSIELIDEIARTPELDEYVHPLETALVDLPRADVSEAGAVRLRNGNPGQVVRTDCEFGDEAWAAYRGQPVAIGVYKAGELHPTRVFNLPQ